MSALDELSIGHRIRNERDARNWSQKMLAKKIIAVSDVGDSTGTEDNLKMNINRWEHNKVAPSPFYLAKLCKAFGKPLEQWGIVEPTYEEPSSIWNVPYHRNVCFTGREEILAQLHDNFSKGKTVALKQPPHAISGLGGIGKTQIAIEYAWRYENEYKAVLWVSATSPDVLVSELVQLAKWLNLPEWKEQNPKECLEAVIRWLQSNRDWLLIVDSADDIEMVSKFLPMLEKGHILLTTRSQAVGANITGIQVEKMSREEGILFILRRAKIIVAGETIENASDADKKDANTLYELLDGLPLALDQAGAYIEETGCSLNDYIGLYKTRYMVLLKRRGRFNQGYTLSVATTWSLNFEQVEQNNPAAAELLRLFAFLHPDAIPEFMIFRCVATFDPTLKATITEKIQCDEALGELLNYSLIQRNRKTGTCSIHRLVQVILKDRMGQDAERVYAVRIIWVLMSYLPSPDTVQSLQEALWNTYLPHALLCARLIEQWEIEADRVPEFLNATGVYLFHHGQHQQAEPLLKRALAINVRRLGTEHPSIADYLNNLANVYSVQGRYEQAEQLYWPALAIYEKVSGPGSPDTADIDTNLANIYSEQGKYERAELLYQRALAIYEKICGADHPRVGTSLNNLANLYIKQGKHKQAEPLLKRALVISVRGLGAGHPSVATCIRNLATVYYAQGKREEYIDLLSNWKRMDEAAEQEKKRLQRDIYDIGLFIQGEHVFLQAAQEPEEQEKRIKKPTVQQPVYISEEIRDYLEDLLTQAGMAEVDHVTKEAMIKELYTQLNKFLMTKIVDYLPLDGLDDFVDFLKTNPDQHALTQYLQEHLPNAQETFITMFADFRDLYLETMRKAAKDARKRQHH